MAKKGQKFLKYNDNKKEEIINRYIKGESGYQLAKEYTKDNTVDLGYFTEDMMVPEFSGVAFAMEKGTYSKETYSSLYRFQGSRTHLDNCTERVERYEE